MTLCSCFGKKILVRKGSNLNQQTGLSVTIYISATEQVSLISAKYDLTLNMTIRLWHITMSRDLCK
ncbi:hypothetical protein HOLleu_04768 [Holothuria leucospilota]|uniref:Uncharacterized protein n=1 Tax=Holothuria leucospilota TaxID=206669 RepID=A0A9Q1CKK9_HOLLE|nr:hypothetical protein HOLleu_04768 [Holothuria leucospilota]